jgi:hypothetical protein
MPIRERPEAGYLPTLASGRLLARWRGGDRMTRLRRRPREVYRVYSEDEYLNGAGSELATVGEWPVSVEPASEVVGGRRSRRVAGVAMLVGAVGMVGGVVVMNDARSHRGARMRPASLVAATRPSRVVRSPIATGARAAPSGRAVAPPSQTTRARVARTGQRRAATNSRPLASPAGVGTRRGGGAVAIVVDYAPAASSGGAAAGAATAIGASAGGSTTTGSTDADTAHAETGRQAEFGFER